MIKIHIREDKNILGEDIKALYISGHADYDEYGKDIVCASVSTIYQLAIMGLRALAEQYPENIKIEEVK